MPGRGVVRSARGFPLARREHPGEDAALLGFRLPDGDDGTTAAGGGGDDRVVRAFGEGYGRHASRREGQEPSRTLLEPDRVGGARPDRGPALDPASLHPLRFNGQAGVVIPEGAEYLSDPVDLPIQALESLGVQLLFFGEMNRYSGHPGSRSTS